MKGLIICETNEVPDRTHKLQVLAKKLMDKEDYNFLKKYRGTDIDIESVNSRR